MFLVIEIQKGITISNIVTSHSTRNDAENKYHTILAYASISDIPKHAAALLTEDGELIKSECFVHEEV